jgi:hypothetical protein
MSFPRLAILALPLAVCLPLLTGGCGAPLAVAAVSYGADGASVIGSGKTTSDHFISMVSKEDCAIWRILRNQDVCRPREGDQNPYDVNYDQPFRQVGESGVEYGAAPHSPANAPAASWDIAAYKAAPQGPGSPSAPATAQGTPAPTQPEPVAQPDPPAPAQAQAQATPPVTPKKEIASHSVPKKKKKKPAVKKPAPDQAAATP